MKIVLDNSGYGLVLTSYGYDTLIRRKKDKGIDTWDKDYIDENINKVWFRCDEDFIDIVEKYGLGITLNECKVHELDSTLAIDIFTDKRVKIEEYVKHMDLLNVLLSS